MITVRIKPISPDQLSAEQQQLDEQIRRMLGGLRTPFTTIDENGALVGPFPVMLHFPELARPLLDWSTAVTTVSVLPVRVREVAILTTGARYGAGYELYSHSRIARAAGLSGTVVAALVAGQRPAELTPEEAVAHDVAARLYTGGPMPGALYRAAVRSFGESGTAELVFLIAQYAGISLVLNAYDVPAPPDAE
ncbi:carboxymuconolactone decarboxylase family protein [Amycolatopsis pithecellobii]|uniref:Carboxymuconolactone decarboxylase family protein n=1 Tax=Amycolatopsis pithecellobii TaxID=664692 RepID=A0A6N7YK39_9PSEU|nr:carboxymuconolactone decarboxylase family protein [Amycolatopsis pithecellobii]MTD53257.1 carboxymuconolactone decarboxylase family protein [Amycolatopsis pithecellobii]